MTTRIFRVKLPDWPLWQPPRPDWDLDRQAAHRIVPGDRPPAEPQDNDDPHGGQ